jgi:hypothetical protein
MENMASHVRDQWFFGAGPFQDGEIHDAPEFAGRRLKKTNWGWLPERGFDQPVASVSGIDLANPHVFPAADAPMDGPVRDKAAVADKRPTALPPVR